MRRTFACLFMLLASLPLTARAQDDASTLTVARWTFEVHAAVVAPYFMGPIHLGTLDDGRNWLVVAFTATNTTDDGQRLNSDAIQLRSDGQRIKQTRDESSYAAEELGALSIDGSSGRSVESGESISVVQVFKVAPDAVTNALTFDFSGEWEVALNALTTRSNGDPRVLLGQYGASEMSGVVYPKWTLETSAYRLKLIGAVAGPMFTGAFHLGRAENQQGWLVTTYQLTNIGSESTTIKADWHRAQVGRSEIKQSTEETGSVASELGMDMLSLKLDAGESRLVVQVFQIPLEAADVALQVDARGELFLHLAPVLQLTNGSAAAVAPGTAVDLTELDKTPTPGTPIATPEPVGTRTVTPTPRPVRPPEQATDVPVLRSPTPGAVASPLAAGSATGRLGGSLADVVTRFGEPSWDGENLIGYNEVALGDTTAILVVHYDENQRVTEMGIVFRGRPAALTSPADIALLVSQVAPVDGGCAAPGPVDPGVGYTVASCSSDSLAEVFDRAYLQAHRLQGGDGSYSYAIDPFPDEYFEIIVQIGVPESSNPQISMAARVARIG